MQNTTIGAPGGLARSLQGREFQLPDGGLQAIRVPQSVVDQVPESVARENAVLPVDFDGETITFATSRDTDVMLQDKLRFILNRNVRFVHIDIEDIWSGIDEYYGLAEGESADSMLQEFTDTAINFCETDCEGVGKLVAELSSPTKLCPLDAPDHLSEGYYPRKPMTDSGNGFMFYTIEEGKRVLAHRRSGKIEILQGPRRVWKGRTRFERMKHFVAHPGQYLSVRYFDGREAIKLGPVEWWQDPREHESITVQECLSLAAKEAVVVYGALADVDSAGNEGDPSETMRRIFYGPGMFAPRPGEWLHRFSWHAAHGGSRGEEKRPDALQFQKLCLMPDQMYHDVRDVRTADDAVLTIRLMIFFELVDIEKMLETTHDPIGDFINAATSDVVEFTGKRSFEEFKQQTEQLNESSTYAQLLHRAEQCGYKINNVVYRGYGAPSSLQAMHDEAIQTRTRLRLERATEEQAQDVEDYKLSCQVERSTRRRREQMAEVQHDLELKRQQADAERKQQELRDEFTRRQRQSDQELELDIRCKSDEQTQAHLASLSAMQVDLTQYLTQARADQVIEVRGSSDVQPELHFANGSAKVDV